MLASSETNVSVGLWNVAWARGATRQGEYFAKHLAADDVVCLTEAHTDVLSGGHQITSSADYGYNSTTDRRKVVLWSRHEWRIVDHVGSPHFPPGRFVSGITNTRCGDIRFIGVCIPWRDAHVSTGRRDRRPWDDHLTFLRHLKPVLMSHADVPTIVLGDFNQRIPRTHQPPQVFGALMSALESFRVVTAGPLFGFPALLIDHLAVSGPLTPTRVDFLSNLDSSGTRVSDHFGLRVLLCWACPASSTTAISQR